MTKGTIVKKKRNIFWGFIFVLFQIQLLNESGPMSFRWDKTQMTILSSVLVVIVFILYLIFKRRAFTMNLKGSLYFIYVILSAFIAFAVNNDFATENFYFIMAVFIGYFTSLVFKGHEYLLAYVYVLFFYSIYSLIGHYILLPSYQANLLPVFNEYYSFLNVPFVDMFFSFSKNWINDLRNQGIFREPGVFQFYILLALAITLFCHNEKNRHRKLFIIIFTITLISTFSTVGLICLLLLFLYYFIVTNRIKIKTIIKLIFCILISTYFIQNIQLVSDTFERTFAKLSEGESNISFVVRFDSFFNNLKLSFKSPFFGNSFVKGFNYIINNYNLNSNTDVTATFFSYIMALGYPLGISIWIQFYLFFRNFFKSNVSFVLYLILMISINTQNLVYSSILWSFIFIRYNKNRGGN